MKMLLGKLFLTFAAATLLLGSVGQLRAGLITAGMDLLLEADKGVTTDGSGGVSRWTDQSGNGHDATQSNASLRPQFVTNAINGNPSLQFNGVNDFLNLNGQVINSQQFTILAVVSDTRNIGDTSHREVFSNWNFSNSITSIFLGTTNTDRARLSDNLSGVGTLSNQSNPFVFTGVSGAADAAIYQNSNLVAALGAPLIARDLTTPYVVGQQGNLSSEYWQGYIAELVVYDRGLSSSELQQDWSYLDQKYFGAASPVPEPSTLALLGLGGIGWAAAAYRRRRTTAI